MAHPDEALDLRRRARRRLIGAIALVLFLVIVPPWVMDLEPKPVETSLEVDIPKPDDRPLPLPPQTAAPQPEAEPEPPPPAPVVEAPAAPAPVEQPEPVAEAPRPPAPAAKESAPAAKAAPKSAGKYIVPVATLSEKGNVKELQAKIGLAGIETYTEPVKTSSGMQTRVRAGPFQKKQEAEKARQRLRELGLKPGNVTTR